MPGIKRRRDPSAFADVDELTMGLEAIESRAPNRRRPPSALPFAVKLLHSMGRQPTLRPGPASSFVALIFPHPDKMCVCGGEASSKYASAKAADSPIERRTKQI